MLLFLFLFAWGALSAPMQYGASEGTSSTTLTTLQEKLKHTFTAKTASYLVQWTAEVHASTNAASIKVRLELDDTTTYNEQEWHPDPDNAPGWAVASGFVVVSLTAGSHDFDIDYASGTSGETASIRRVRILVSEINV